MIIHNISTKLEWIHVSGILLNRLTRMWYSVYRSWMFWRSDSVLLKYLTVKTRIAHSECTEYSDRTVYSEWRSQYILKWSLYFERDLNARNSDFRMNSVFRVYRAFRIRSVYFQNVQCFYIIVFGLSHSPAICLVSHPHDERDTVNVIILVSVLNNAYIFTGMITSLQLFDDFFQVSKLISWHDGRMAWISHFGNVLGSSKNTHFTHFCQGFHKRIILTDSQRSRLK